ncbi:MAG: class I SAM-dependent methyltransferase [Actinomycetota bacterium]
MARRTNAALEKVGVRVERAGPRRVIGVTGDPPERLARMSSCPTLDEPSAAMVEKAKSIYSYSFPISADSRLSREEIDRRVDEAFWASPYEFGGRRVPNKIGGAPFGGYEHRRFMHMFPALLSVTGGSLEGRTVLDVASHVGFWSVQARAAGADRVVGVEAAAKSVEVAKFVLQITGLDRISFQQQNAYDISPEDPGVFDITLYLGLLYHLDKPVSALERLAAVTKQLAVVDTQVVPSSWPVCLLGPEYEHEEGESFHSNVLKMLPSRGAVVMMLKHAGFREVFYVPKGTKDLPQSYREDRRETFIALK